MKYRVELSAKAYVKASVEVDATSRAEAETKALDTAYGGDVLWKYDGAEDDTAQVEAVESAL